MTTIYLTYRSGAYIGGTAPVVLHPIRSLVSHIDAPARALAPDWIEIVELCLTPRACQPE